MQHLGNISMMYGSCSNNKQICLLQIDWWTNLYCPLNFVMIIVAMNLKLWQI